MTVNPISFPDSKKLIRLADLPKHITPGRGGKRRHASAVYRYAERGVRGILLETWQLPDAKYTTLDAWDNFVRRLTAARKQPEVAASKTLPVHENRQRKIEVEIENVRATLRKKGGN